MVRLSAGAVTGGRDPPGQRINRWADDALATQPVAGELQQDSGRVVLQRSCQKELVELFAFAGAGGPPAEAIENLIAMVATGAAFPTTVGAEQRWRGAESQTVGKALQCCWRAGVQLIGDPAQPRQRAQLNGDAEQVLATKVRGQPAELIVDQREERDQVIVGDLARPSAEPGKLSIGQKPNWHEAR